MRSLTTHSLLAHSLAAVQNTTTAPANDKESGCIAECQQTRALPPVCPPWRLEIVRAVLLGTQEAGQALLWLIINQQEIDREIQPAAPGDPDPGGAGNGGVKLPVGWCTTSNVIVGCVITAVVWLVPVSNACIYRYANAAPAAKRAAGRAWFSAGERNSSISITNKIVIYLISYRLLQS